MCFARRIHEVADGGEDAGSAGQLERGAVARDCRRAGEWQHQHLLAMRDDVVLSPRRQVDHPQARVVPADGIGGDPGADRPVRGAARGQVPARGGHSSPTTVSTADSTSPSAG